MEDEGKGHHYMLSNSMLDRRREIVIQLLIESSEYTISLLVNRNAMVFPDTTYKSFITHLVSLNL